MVFCSLWHPTLWWWLKMNNVRFEYWYWIIKMADDTIVRYWIIERMHAQCAFGPNVICSDMLRFFSSPSSMFWKRWYFTISVNTNYYEVHLLLFYLKMLFNTQVEMDVSVFIFSRVNGNWSPFLTLLTYRITVGDQTHAIVDILDEWMTSRLRLP